MKGGYETNSDILPITHTIQLALRNWLLLSQASILDIYLVEEHERGKPFANANKHTDSSVDVSHKSYEVNF